MSELRPQSFQAPPEVDRLMRTAGLIGAVGLIASVAGAVANPAQFYRSYLVAYLFILAPALGSLAWMMIHYLSGGAWGLGVRRLFEAGSRTLPLLVVLFIPIAFGMHHLYEWTHLDAVAKDPILQHKQPYLNTGFFLVRAAIYFAVWCGLALVLTNWSRAQDEHPTPEGADAKFRVVSGPGLLAYGLTMSFAAFDWVMSLDPHWYSTIFGLLLMVGQGLSTLAFTIAMAFFLSRTAPLEPVLTPNKFHDYGKLLFAFTMLWAYLSFSQFLIVWSANLPEEIPWYIRRLQGGWGAVSLAIALGHFIFPFLMLLSSDLKRHASRLALLASFVLVMRYIDLYWLVMPQFHEGRLEFHWLDVATVVGLFGLWLAAYCWNLKGRALIPVGDPYLEEALADGHH
jgi:hypothetical protein